MSAPKKHAKYAASSSHRWLNCPGSVRLSEKAPPQYESPFAIEGTQAHEVFEVFMKNFLKPEQARRFLGTKYSLEMIDYAHHARNTVFNRWRKLETEGTVHSELQVSLDHIHPDMFGTFDCAIVEPFGDLVVYDYKYGAGIPVDVKGNSQLAFYAVGAARKFGGCFERVENTIIQPRAEHKDGSTRTSELSMRNLDQWETVFKKGVEACEKPNAPLKAGSWCQFCPARSICPVISKNAFTQAAIVFAPEENNKLPVLRDAGKIAIPRLGEILTAAEMIEVWISEIRGRAFAALSHGEKIKGWKLVDKQARRKWLDANKASKLAAKTFGLKAFESPALLSPAQLEKISPKAKAFVKKLSVSVSSGLTIAPESDQRPPVNPIENVFDEIGEENEKPKAKTGKNKKKR